MILTGAYACSNNPNKDRLTEPASTTNPSDSIERTSSFERRYYLYSDWSVLSSALEDKNGYIAVGYTEKENHSVTDGVTLNLQKINEDKYAGLILKLNSRGDTVWSKILNKSETDFIYNICETRDGNYFLIGSAKTGNNEQMFLLKMDPAGKEVFYKTYPSDKCRKGSLIIKDNESGYIIAGERVVSKDKVSKALFKIDETGSVIWTSNNKKEKRITLTCIKKTRDGGTLLAGAAGDQSSMTDLYLSKIDAQGKFLWDKTFPGDGYSLLNGIEEAGNGYMLLGSMILSNSFVVIKVDSLFKKISQKAYPHSFSREVCSIIKTKENDYVIGGIEGTGGNSRNILLARINQEGDTLWTKSYPSAQMIYSMSSTSDGGYLLSGFDSFGMESGSGCLVKVDKDGMLKRE
jgi:hypothetical protein